jgi:phosphoserine phosphatase
VSEPVCVDSSVLVKLLTGEPGSEAAVAVVTDATDLVVPAFAWAEVGSALRKKVRMGEIDARQAQRAWDDLLSLDLRYLQRPALMTRTWQLAESFALPTMYDAAFVAAAEQAPGGPCPFWTADASLVRAVGGRHPLIRGLGQPEPDLGPTRLVAFDLDGTLLRGETACEAIARAIGRLDEMRAFEALTDRGDIAAARREMARWYGEAGQAAIGVAIDGLALAPGAEVAFAWLRRCGVRTAIVSITWDFAVAAVARRLGADDWVGTTLSPTGEVGDFWAEDKARWLAALAEGYGLGPDRVAAVGDSAGDLPMLRWAGRAVFVGGRLPPEVQGGAIHLPGADLMAAVAAICLTA